MKAGVTGALKNLALSSVLMVAIRPAKNVPEDTKHAFAESLQIPGYDAAVVGYPQRMRDYNTRNKKHPDLR